MHKIIRFCEILMKIDDSEIFHECMYAVSDLSKSDNLIIQNILDNGLHNLAFKGLSTNLDYVTYPSLQLLGNVCSGNHDQTQKIIDLQIIDKLIEFINHNNLQIQHEVYWILSNIAAGTEAQIELI